MEDVLERHIELLDELQAAEANYRHAHDLYGADDIKTGRAWDHMRRAGDRARVILSEKLPARTLSENEVGR